ncbi:hypothetical protein [Paraburkholderia silvatlantica]|uniref:BrnA antitoxin of type II toxin-antitoxin system n=1 Tax=Paraburkholderia silvatlantica TaxID=321895 RepID=A0ABR6FYG4_9BURK|nr:hypothetical protein [Paraburkholderia silvatlantica]MBB2932461.1 hypothetical protein [Paraburkholderia silvatlantica]PVY22358.1 hypothetical protein C7411_13262 [Paraburkholderia silvatlantica]PXW27873.1 hypothetical protein C7413_13362 [Paraburkholderia silvatlantica]
MPKTINEIHSTSKTKYIHIRIDDKLQEMMRAYADTHSINWSSYVRKYIEATIKSNKNKKGE